MKSGIVRAVVLVAVVAALAAVAVGFAGCTNGQSVSTRGRDVADTLSSTKTGLSMTSTPLVHGMIVFKSSRPDLTGVTVYVRLEDVSRADASAQIVSEQVIADPANRVTAEGIPFSLRGSRRDIDSQRHYEVAVHVDIDGSGDVSADDYINTESNPVLTHGYSAHAIVSVEKID